MLKYESIQSDYKKLKELLQIVWPFVDVSYSTLGGKENVSILIAVSSSLKQNWPNGYIENSAHARFHLDTNGKLEHFAGWKLGKFRKCSNKTIEQVAERLNKFAQN